MFNQALCSWMVGKNLSAIESNELHRVFYEEIIKCRQECGDLIKHFIEKSLVEIHDLEDFKITSYDIIKEKPHLLTDKEQAELFRHYRKIFKNLAGRNPRKVLREDHEEIR